MNLTNPHLLVVALVLGLLHSKTHIKSLLGYTLGQPTCSNTLKLNQLALFEPGMCGPSLLAHTGCCDNTSNVTHRFLLSLPMLEL